MTVTNELYLYVYMLYCISVAPLLLLQNLYIVILLFVWAAYFEVLQAYCEAYWLISFHTIYILNDN